MKLLTTLCTILLTIFPTISPLPPVRAQSPLLSARALDSLLQAHAYTALFRPKTGVPYDGDVPANLTGVGISALRLRSGSLRTRGFNNYKEFSLPIGLVAQPYVERLVLVYHNLGNWSSLLYPLPGYTYLVPILGLLGYNGSDLSAQNLPELDLTASENAITIRFRDLKLGQNGTAPKCVHFDLDGSVDFSNVLDGNLCLVTEQGHFSIVIESIVAAEPLSPPPSGGDGGYGKRNYDEAWVIGGAVIGGFGLLVLLGMSVGFVKNWRERKRVGRGCTDRGVALRNKAVWSSRVPTATGTSTRPVVENEYVL